MQRTVGLLHPGSMGASVGAAAARSHEVLWCPEGRSAVTQQRADDAGLRATSFAELCARSEILLSVCPPAEAVPVATSVREQGFTGLYVDANAISGERVREVAAALASPDVTFVDGGIIGPPAWRPGSTRLYLSGERADDVAHLFASTALDAVVINGDIGTASALKMCYAAWTKGSSALLFAVRAVAEAEGVTADLLAEWDLSQPQLGASSDRSAMQAGPKAWRFAGEMEEIADTFAGAGLPDGFFRSASELYGRLGSLKDRHEPPVQLDEVITLLLAGTGDEANDPLR